MSPLHFVLLVAALALAVLVGVAIGRHRAARTTEQPPVVAVAPPANPPALEAEVARLRQLVEDFESEQGRRSERRLEAQRRLVADVSHELKTPLTAIRGYAETLQEGAASNPETADRFLHRILDQCERLEALLRDLLTLSRLDAGQALGTTQPVDLVDLTRDVLEVLETHATEAGVTLELEVASPRPPAIAARPEHAERLLLNLVENAIKYNRTEGTVRVSLEQEAEGVVIAVTDSGIGIPSQDLDRIFERFYRVDRGRTRGEGGSGLGLAIVDQMVRDLGGHIHVESQLGQGSTFRVTLPSAA